MRVIAGTRRSMPLKTIEGLATRPTQDRTKETLFNVIQNDVPGSMFLDLFSGSGAIAIEALSRGAKKAYLVENSRAAAACIRDNLNFTRLSDEAVLMETDAVTALKRLEGKTVFDIIFMDPPYNHEYEKEVLTCLADSSLIDDYSIIIVEASNETSFDYLAVYPGSFDPVTLGHMDIISRSSKLFDKLIVGVLVNSSKVPLFSAEERVNMIKGVVSEYANVEVRSFDGLLVEFARLCKATAVVRGLRAVTDFEYELQMSQTNHIIAPDIDTIFLTTNLNYAYLSSSVVKEVARYGGDISKFVAPEVRRQVLEKYNR